MTEKEVFEKLQFVIAETFGIKNLDVRVGSGQKTIEKWDSIGHLKLIMAAESEFGIIFKTNVISHFTTVELVQAEILNEQ